MKLIDKIKPEVLESLENCCEPQYSSSYRAIIANFSSIDDYRDLSIKQVGDLLTFLPEEYHPNGKTDFYWGDYLLKKEYQL